MLRYPVAQKIGGEIVTTVIEKHGPVCFLVTTTRANLHAENETRMLSLETDDSQNQTRAVLVKVAETIGEQGIGAIADIVDVAPWHDFQRWLAAGNRNVVIPYADRPGRADGRRPRCGCAATSGSCSAPSRRTR